MGQRGQPDDVEAGGQRVQSKPLPRERVAVHGHSEPMRAASAGICPTGGSTSTSSSGSGGNRGPGSVEYRHWHCRPPAYDRAPEPVRRVGASKLPRMLTQVCALD